MMPPTVSSKAVTTLVKVRQYNILYVWCHILGNIDGSYIGGGRRVHYKARSDRRTVTCCYLVRTVLFGSCVAD